MCEETQLQPKEYPVRQSVLESEGGPQSSRGCKPALLTKSRRRGTAKNRQRFANSTANSQSKICRSCPCFRFPT